MKGVKHLIECHCVLPQYRDKPEPIYHQFIVFSAIDDEDNVIPKLAQCNNCGVVHRVTDVSVSEIFLGDDSDAAVMSLEDIRASIPDSIARVLDSYKADVATWEEVAFILEHQCWDLRVNLSSENDGDEIRGKCLRFTGPSTFKIEPYSMRLTLG